jgi:hypothetical protein
MKRIALAGALALVATHASPTAAQPLPPPPAETPPPVRAKAPAVLTEITDIQPTNGGVTITIAAGSEQGVAVGWKGVALDVNGKLIAGSQFTVLRVTKVASLAKVGLAPGKLTSGDRARLDPP